MGRPAGRYRFTDKTERLRKRAEKKAALEALKNSAHGDLLPIAEPKLTAQNLNPTPEQQKVIDAKRRHWLQFVWAIPFRIYYEITGELPPVPPSGTFAYNGWTKIGVTPWDYVLSTSMAYTQPFLKKEHYIAYSVIAEFYTRANISGPGGKEFRPGRNDDWKDLLPRAEELIQKWTKQDDFLNHTFPEALKLARMEKRLSQGEVADMIGYQFLAVSRWERGEYEPSPQAIYEIAKELPTMKRWFKYHPDWVKSHGAVI